MDGAGALGLANQSVPLSWLVGSLPLTRAMEDMAGGVVAADVVQPYAVGAGKN